MVVDVAWGPGLAAVAAGSALVGNGDRTRRGLLAAGIGAWGLRLGSHLLDRVRSTDEEDERYAELTEGDSETRKVLKIFVGQGLAQWAVGLPVQVAAASGPVGPLGRVLVALGASGIAGGLVLESVADRQKSAFYERDPDERPEICRDGVWGWSRHPNYFGDACVWNGAYLVAAAASPGAWTFLSPAIMTYLLVWGSGAKPSEQRLKGREGYDAYRREVSFFVPLPPRERRA
ncbi:hypothetical protein LUZ63_021785 [Rhynchospora breviuscula]|uniref:Steroid 5-alpha reductase C-terminal domain-containing protein n=1 Tax=Rhynchospora breviuscula TaxID=2022672 RepID=A0A9P9Z620_9POAL|nr:hypothetical protein LUZ63_021785 [Rhynchospora breviuscula]